MSTVAISTPPAPAAVKLSAEEQLHQAQDLFIRRWGEMGATWGINRTMAEIHALLVKQGLLRKA